VILRNRQKTGGVPKSAAIIAAASALTAAGVHTAHDLDPDSLDHRRAYCNVRGLGPVTWTYFTMLLGQPGVKADTWIVRFVTDALSRPRSVPSTQAEALVTAAAEQPRSHPPRWTTPSGDTSARQLGCSVTRSTQQRRPSNTHVLHWVMCTPGTTATTGCPTPTWRSPRWTGPRPSTTSATAVTAKANPPSSTSNRSGPPKRWPTRTAWSAPPAAAPDSPSRSWAGLPAPPPVRPADAVGW